MGAMLEDFLNNRLDLFPQDSAIRKRITFWTGSFSDSEIVKALRYVTDDGKPLSYAAQVLKNAQPTNRETFTGHDYTKDPVIRASVERVKDGRKDAAPGAEIALEGRKLAFVAGTIYGDTREETEANYRELRHRCRTLWELGWVPVAPALYFTQFLKPGDKALERATEWMIRRCSEFFFYGEKLTPEIEHQIDYAMGIGKRVHGLES